MLVYWLELCVLKVYLWIGLSTTWLSLENQQHCTNSKTRWLKSAQMGSLNGYKKLLSTKQKVFTFKDSLKRGIRLSPSEMHMPNSIILALLTCLHLLKEYVICWFILNISVLFYTISVGWEITSNKFGTVPFVYTLI